MGVCRRYWGLNPLLMEKLQQFAKKNPLMLKNQNHMGTLSKKSPTTTLSTSNNILIAHMEWNIVTERDMERIKVIIKLAYKKATISSRYNAHMILNTIQFYICSKLIFFSSEVFKMILNKINFDCWNQVSTITCN